MNQVKSIGELMGVAETPVEETGSRSVAAQGLWLSDFEGAPEWFLRKYFRDELGRTCGRMRVKAFAHIGDIISEGGKPTLNRWGKPAKLTTGYLAKRVSEDCEKAGYPNIRVHFRGYSLDPVRFAMRNAFLQEEYEENEARHVPGLDEDEQYVPSNAQAPLDEALWESCACFAMNALRTHTLMYWGLDEDFGRLMSAPDFVHSAYNAYLAGLWARIGSMVSPETLQFVSRINDFSMFDADDVIRTYAKAMRLLTGKDYGEDMLDSAWILCPDVDESLVKAALENARRGILTVENAFGDEDLAALILANDDLIDEAPEWEPEESDLADDDSGEACESLLMKY